MDAEARKRRTLPLAVLCAIACGAGVAVQSRINGQLGAELHDGYLAAVISFGSGLVILSLVMLFAKSGRTGAARVRSAIRSKEIPWFYAVGGAAGGFFVLTQGLTSAALGVALFSIGVVCGQTVSGVVIDRIGLGHVDPRPLTLQRLGGAALALVAVAVAASSQFSGGSNAWLLLLPFAAGLAIAWQQGVNGQIRMVSGSVLTATFGNFLVGTTVLVVAATVHTAIVGWPAALPSNPVLYIGGSIGILFIGLGAAVVGVTGVLLLTLGTISGQLIMSLVLDLVVPVAEHPVQFTTVVGVVLALAAVVIVATAKSSNARR
jgi:bacterial/archaeal transporter family-2 protein